jgi:RNA polymerase sigma factor for flagellar operon FliA
MEDLTEKLSQRNLLIRGHLDLARRHANRMARRLPSTINRDELESAALLGLTEAAERFDPEKGETFAAFAAKRVRGAILDELRRNDVLTRRGRERAKHLAKFMATMQQTEDRAPTVAEIAKELEIGEEVAGLYWSRLVSATLVPFEKLHEVVQDKRGIAPDKALAKREQRAAMTEAMGLLSARDLEVISRYYGAGHTLKEIGSQLGVSESRVCQIRTRALRSLRKAMPASLETTY